MNFKLTHPLPENCVVAVSGGLDSMSAFHFLRQTEGRVERVIHINHATGDFADEAETLVREICDEQKISLTVRAINVHIGEGESRENFWREQRYRLFWDEYATYNLPIILAHTLDDCLEEYIICTMVRGYSGTIPYRHGFCIRPFRMWKRRDIESYARKNHIQYIDDPSNRDEGFMRAKVRSRIVPRIKNLNPGVYNIVERIVREQDKRNELTDP